MRFALIALCLLSSFTGKAQQQQRIPFLSLEIPDTLHKPRFWTATSLGIAGYTATMIGLNQAWYADYPKSSFHLFNDSKEWLQMDKAGHLFSAYTEARWVFNGARWTGIKPKKSAWIGWGAGQLMQASFEVLDGYSDQWGFSLSDIGFNAAGSSLFLAQELGWKEQRIVLKMSAWPVKYSALPIPSTDGMGTTTLAERAEELYGTGFVNLYLKNYNALTIWASANIHSFLPNRETSRFPRWLNVAVGMGADNLYSGFGYGWAETKNCVGPQCKRYVLDPNLYPRTRQWYLSADIDLTKLPIKNRFLRSAVQLLNIVKFPAPALELKGGKQLRFLWVQ
jgi:hypothetical protein